MNIREWSDKSFTILLNKLKEFRKFVPEEEFKEFLIHRDFSNRTFLHLLPKFGSFKIAFDFLYAEFGVNFVQEFLLTSTGYFRIQSSISEFTKFINLFKLLGFDKHFVKTILSRKDGFFNTNFLSFSYGYSDPENLGDLLALLDSIFSICGADLELFKELFFSRSGFGRTFFIELTENYKNEKLKLVTDWIEKNLGHDLFIFTQKPYIRQFF